MSKPPWEYEGAQQVEHPIFVPIGGRIGVAERGGALGGCRANCGFLGAGAAGLSEAMGDRTAP